MKIGIDASRAFIKKRTGIEEYSYQVIKNLRGNLKDAQVVLYLKKNQDIDFKIPKKWKIRKLWMPYLWTQVRLSLEMIFRPVDALFIPAHVVPIIHPKNTFVTIHGLEYEFCPEAYSMWDRIYMRWSIKNSCRWAKEIISVSENSKNDLVNLYGISEKKIKIIHEGYDKNVIEMEASHESEEAEPYLFFIGRLEERKNIIRIIEAFEKFKENCNTSHKLILSGSPGHGYGKIKEGIEESKYKNQIILTGFVDNIKRVHLMENADVFLFPTLYEGFGLPVLEAQILGTPVVTSKTSSLPEISGEGAVLVDPKKSGEISEAIGKLVLNPEIRNDIIRKGKENAKRFSWEKCSKEISELIIR